jgi:hypothetical protein
MTPQTGSAPAPLEANAFTTPTGCIGPLSPLFWNTKKDGSGTWYANMAMYPFNASVTLYAQWDC